MSFTLPDYNEASYANQSVLFQEYLDVISAGLQNIDCVLSGLAVTGGADMTPAVAKGGVLTNRLIKSIAAADVTVTAADGTNPRIDLIVVNSSGALAVRAGTAAAAPKPPARTANDVVIASVYVPAGATAISQSLITDLRVAPTYPVTLYKTTVAEVTNNTASAVNILDKTNGGVTIPSGLFTAGRILRCYIGGHTLMNSGSVCTHTVTFKYGGTTMFEDVSGAQTAGATECCWGIEFVIVAQANNDQALNGYFSSQVVGAKTGPTNGIGDTFNNGMYVTGFAGSAAVDSDAGNRLVEAQWTMSVANAANQVTVDVATLELL